MAKIIYKKLSIKEKQQTSGGVYVPCPEGNCPLVKPDIPCMGGSNPLWELRRCGAWQQPSAPISQL